MTVRVAINGFGRIGRNVLRAIIESGRTDIQIVAINDLGPIETNAHLLRFDSVHGRFPGVVEVDGDTITARLGGYSTGPIKVTAIKNPAELPHASLGVDVAMECTGIFNSKEKASAHLAAGAKRVLVSAPADGADLTVVYGVNDDKLGGHLIVSNASCTTNCLAPVAKVLHDLVGIDKGFMTTIHSYTGDQPTLDTYHKDLYRARGAALSMIPTSTGAAKAVGLVLPELSGRLDGTAIRVPTPNVSVVDFKFLAKRATSKDEINAAVRAAANGRLLGILGVTDKPNVSMDFNHDSRSSVVHLDETKVMDGNLVRVLSWYDNEWGFSCRMADTAVAMGRLLAGTEEGRRYEVELPRSPAIGQARVRTLNGANLDGKSVLLRADLNVPVHEGKVTDTTRLERLVPSIRDLTSKGARVFVLSHFGRPKGRDPRFSLGDVAGKLKELMTADVRFVGDCIGDDVRRQTACMFPGEVAVLENLRFHPGEEANDLAFAREIAALGDIYVNDAFSCAHRAHASTHAIAKLIPSYAGATMQAELAALAAVLDQPQRPIAAVVGGAKVSSKIALLENLVRRVDAIIIGGGMANTFLLAQGKQIGRSLVEPDRIETANRILAAADKARCRIVLPMDVIVAKELKKNAAHVVAPIDAVPSDGMILDVGSTSANAIAELLRDYRTLLWNGPLGAFETPPFDAATFAVARAAAELTRAGRLRTIAGGGDTVAALNAAGVTDSFTYVSTAGGAFLEWLEGKTLPGVEVLLHDNTSS